MNIANLNMIESNSITNDYDCNKENLYLNNIDENSDNDFFITGSQGGLKNYLSKLPLEVVVVRNNAIDLKTRKSIIVQSYLGIFLSALENVLLSTRILYKSSNNFPPLYVKWLDDNSVLIEWIYKDFRIGFTIEPDIKDSGWYIISNKNLGEYSASGIIDFNNITALINHILIFAFRNS